MVGLREFLVPEHKFFKVGLKLYLGSRIVKSIGPSHYKETRYDSVHVHKKIMANLGFKESM